MEEFIGYTQRIYVNGELYEGQLLTEITTDPVISIKQLLRGDTEGVKVTTRYSLLHVGGDAVPIEPKEIKGTVNMHGSILAIEL